MDRCWITDAAISETDVRPLVETPEAGAIVLFLGVVRNHADGRAVRGLEYEAYPAMVEKTINAIVAEARQRWHLHRVAVVHRVGRLEVGETSVAIAVSSSHRREAFDACSFIMDRVKADAPIWKKELWADGSDRWVGDADATSDETVLV
jgi:molybdopterin synthase catalytic subunit